MYGPVAPCRVTSPLPQLCQHLISSHTFKIFPSIFDSSTVSCDRGRHRNLTQTQRSKNSRRVRAQHVTSLQDTPMIMSTTLLNDRTLESSDIIYDTYANMANGPWYATSETGQRTADSGQNGNLPTLRLCDDASSFAISQRVASPLTHSHLVPNC